MIEFAQFIEMANLFPQFKGDSLERVRTTHMGFPVYSPSIFYLIQHRDKEKYPDGMTGSEIAEELLKSSEGRSVDLRPGEEAPPEDWADIIRKHQMTKFVRGINSMLSKSKDFVAVDTRVTGGRGRAPSVYLPTEEAQARLGGKKFLSRDQKAALQQQPTPEPKPEVPLNLAPVDDKEALADLQAFLDEK